MSNKRTCIQGTHLPTDIWSSIIDMVPSVVNHTKAHERKVAEYQKANPGHAEFAWEFAHVVECAEAAEAEPRQVHWENGEWVIWYPNVAQALLAEAVMVALDDEFPWY